MPRIPLISGETLTPEQRVVYEKIVSGLRGTLVGPLRAALHVPELADRWQHLGEYVRYKTSLPPVLSELAILVTAHRWQSALEWHIHSKSALQAGVSAEIVEAIATDRSPAWTDAGQHAVFEFTRELQNTGFVSDVVYQDAYQRLGTQGIVELTAIIGYYTMVAFTLNAHEILMPPEPQEPR